MQKFSNVNFMKPLIASMTQRDPADRPTAEEAFAHWRKLRKGICFIRRGALLRPIDTASEKAIVFDVVAFLKVAVLLSRRLLMWTSRWVKILERIN